MRFWVEPTVWTERMLAALEQGVKGGKWFSLIDKVHPERTLRAAFSQVAANEGAAGVDHVTISMFESHLDEELKRLSDQLRNGTYRPQLIRRHYIPKPGTQEKRPLGIPTVRDRVVQTAAADGDGTDLRARIRRAQLRLSPQTGMQRRAATSG